MRFSPSGSHLAIGCKNGSLVIMKAEAGGGDSAVDEKGSFSLETNDMGKYSDPQTSAGGVHGASDRTTRGGRDGETLGRSASFKGDGASSYRRPFYRRIAHLKGHSSRVLHVDWTVDGRLVHTCGQDYQILHWEILPPPSREDGSCGASYGDYGDGWVAGEFRPRMFQRAFLLRDVQWSTWSSTIGWSVQVRT